MAKLSGITLLLSCIAGILAQSDVLTACDPKNQTGCPTDQALQTDVLKTDFTAGESDKWRKVQQGADKISYDKDNGAVLTIAKQGDSPTFLSKDYIFYGKAEVVMKAAPGKGIVSSLFLASDCLDEIDFEFLGVNHAEIQSNYFRGGNHTLYDRGASHAVNGVDEFHTYTLEYTPAGMTFSIDGAVARSISAASIKPVDIGPPSPQTPMFVRVGMWASGDPNNEPGTIEWGGGPTDYSKPYSMYIKSVTLTNYSPANKYTYKNQGSAGACNEANIAIDGGELMSRGSGAVPPPPGGGSSSKAPPPPPSTSAPKTTGNKAATTSTPADTPTPPPPSTPTPSTTGKPSPSPSTAKSSGGAGAIDAARALGLAAVLLGGSLLLV